MSSSAPLGDAATRRLPNLFILGNPKSGSTFLFSCLRSGPFDPNVLHSSYAQWRDGTHLLTTLGSKKEFNFWGGPSWSYGWEWYAGAPASLSAWQWTDEFDPSETRRRRRGENGNGEPNALVSSVCPLNATVRRRLPKKAVRAACRRFPLECFGGAPLVRPGCALVRPFPPKVKGCGRGGGAPPCETPRYRMSHAWPPAAEASARSWLLDPSINTMMSYPLAAEHMRLHHPSPPASLRFIVLLREPLARAQSSARMMREWKWDKSANLSEALMRDLGRLERCCEAIAPTSRAPLANDGASGLEAAASLWERASNELVRLSDSRLLRFRQCLAKEAPLNHVRASIYAAGVLGWLGAGFGAAQFLWLETEAMRSMDATTLLTTIARFTGMPTEHLNALPPHVRKACAHPSAVQPEGRRLLFARDGRMQTHARQALPPAVSARLAAAFNPFNALMRTLLSDAAPELRSVPWLA